MSETFRAFMHEHIAAGQPSPVPVGVAITPDHEKWAEQVHERAGIQPTDSINIAAAIGAMRLLAMKHGLQLVGQTRQDAIIEPAALPSITAETFEGARTRTFDFLPRNWSYLEWMKKQGRTYEETIFTGMHTLGSLATSRAGIITVRPGTLQEATISLSWLEKVA